MKEGRIGLQEAVCLITITISVKVYFTSPTFVAKAVGPSSWFMTLISASTAMVGFSILCALLNRFPGKDLPSIFEETLGKPIAMVFTLIFTLFFMANASILLREFAEVLKVYTLPLTPISFILISMLIMICFSCFLGLESIARAARVLSFLLLAGFLIVILFAYNNYDYHYLFPLFGYGIDRTVIFGLARSSFYSEVIALGIIAASLQGIHHIKKAGYVSLAISGLIVSLTLCTTTMAFDYGVAQEIVSRLYTLARIIHIGAFLQRLDPFFLFTWCIGTLIGTSFLFYCTLSSYCKCFQIKDMKPLIIPTGILFMALGMLPKDLPAVTEYVNALRQYGWAIISLPLISLAVSIIRKKGGTNHA